MVFLKGKISNFKLNFLIFFDKCTSYMAKAVAKILFNIPGKLREYIYAYIYSLKLFEIVWDN